MRVISGGMVAEKNSVCRVNGIISQMRSISGMKPMSSIRSASSMTRISTPVEQKLAAFAVVEQTARRRDQHVGATLQLLVLLVERHAADQKRDVELVVLAVSDEILFDLGGEFARRLQDQRARHAGACPALFEAGQHRQHKGSRLAGAGLGDAQNILAEQGVRDGTSLDRRRLGVAGIGDCGKDLRRQAEVCEGQRFLSGRGV